jgi:hypothetical protein
LRTGHQIREAQVVELQAVRKAAGFGLRVGNQAFEGVVSWGGAGLKRDRIPQGRECKDADAEGGGEDETADAETG